MPIRHFARTVTVVGIIAGGTCFGIRAATATCHSYQCGGNSPIIIGQPIANLDLTGAAHDGVQLNPVLLAAPRCATDHGRVRTLTVGIERGELIATEGAYVCRGADLIEAELGLTVTPGAKPRAVTLIVADAEQMPTWERTKTTPYLLWSYRFEVREALTTVDFVRVGKRLRKVVVQRRHDEPLCSSRPSYEDWQDFRDADALVFQQTKSNAIMSMRAANDHALLVQGAAFSDTGSVIKADGVIRTGPQWFNIACVGTAVAKMRLLGVDPMNELADATGAPVFAAWAPAPPGTAAATLKMLGARYDGHTVHTEPGTPLVWARAWRRPQLRPTAVGFDPDEGFYGRPVRLDGTDMELGPIEAGWNAFGATCLSHFRPPMTIGELRLRGSATRFAAASEARAVARLRTQLRLPACDPAALPAGTLWVTTTVDHPLHLGDAGLPERYVVDGLAVPVATSGSAVPTIKRPVPPRPDPAIVQPVPIGNVGTQPVPTAHPTNPTVPVAKPPVVVKPPVVPGPKAPTAPQ